MVKDNDEWKGLRGMINVNKSVTFTATDVDDKGNILSHYRYRAVLCLKTERAVSKFYYDQNMIEELRNSMLCEIRDKLYGDIYVELMKKLSKLHNNLMTPECYYDFDDVVDSVQKLNRCDLFTDDK